MNLSDRIKNYEKAYDIYMPSRLPVIIRVDGKGFSKFTKSIKASKPFDKFFSGAMAQTMKHAAEKIEGCIFAFTQSDEITFVVENDQSYESTPWFGNRIQKITSVVSSFVTAAFNQEALNYFEGNAPLAYFDARVFVVPTWRECINVLIWRQNDATKNSISSATYYEVAAKIGKKTTRKKMHGLNQKQQQELLFQEVGINWNDYPTKFKRGIGCYKVSKEMALNGNIFMRSSWELDEELPVFTREQEFLRNILGIEEEVSIEQSQSLEGNK